ncbi:uncharacterized protein SOCEGT47_048270 [Sorangium cellulosum]|uniref:Copper type II ascorbate-dependent monooxygenase C-terminal domain-containing protein n=1 Tax=Sorangium cellulosum TaxID=56 RepID=A0A4P2Q4J6_SORCE|nr:hypothetical protein [Sorangium cellulosum]AUX24290.1 uncharacterized protein SOCEGT47_048270 [Sorangium cellulosum]
MHHLRPVSTVSTFVLLAAVTSCASGCGASEGPDGSGKAAAVTTFEATAGPWTLDPGGEKTECLVFRLDNPEGAFIRRLRGWLGDGSHHMTLYKSVDAVERREPFPCAAFESSFRGDRPIFIAQQRQTELSFPHDEEGTPIGFRIEPRQMVRIEMHYVNMSPEPASVESRILLETVPLSTKVVETDIAFWTTFDIEIPPSSAHATEVKFTRGLEGSRSFALTTHQHHLATRMRVWHADSASDAEGRLVANSTDWANPPLEIFDPPLVFGDGGKTGLAFQCEWTNPTPRTVTVGESVEDEMCLLWHYYYPSRGFHYVVVP